MRVTFWRSMKLSGLQFSLGVSLFCHAVAFGVVTYCGQALPPAELRVEDLPLTVTLLRAPEAAPVQPAASAAAASPAPLVEPDQLPAQPLREVKSPEPLPVENLPATEPVVALPEPASARPPPPAPPAVAVVTTPSEPAIAGVGSAQPAGIDRAPALASAGARARADYRRNPKPLYPPAARRRRQEGTVLLSVQVTSQGRANRVVLKQSSGFTLLDEAALQTVRDWDFEPARIGAVAVESAIEVPVRFQLGD